MTIQNIETTPIQNVMTIPTQHLKTIQNMTTQIQNIVRIPVQNIMTIPTQHIMTVQNMTIQNIIKDYSRLSRHSRHCNRNWISTIFSVTTV